MSFWNDIAKPFESVGRAVGGAAESVGKATKKAVEDYPMTIALGPLGYGMDVTRNATADMRKEASRLAEQGVNSYNNTKMEMQAEAARVEAEKNAERDRIQEKQIQSMRRAYRAPGFMEPETNNGLATKLG